MRLDRAQADAMAEQLRILAQSHRLTILATLIDRERPVGEIEAVTGIGQPALSQQLAELRRAGLVTTRREARKIHYRIVDAETEERLRSLFSALGAENSPDRPRWADTKRADATFLFGGAAAFVRMG